MPALIGQSLPNWVLAHEWLYLEYISAWHAHIRCDVVEDLSTETTVHKAASVSMLVYDSANYKATRGHTSPRKNAGGSHKKKTGKHRHNDNHHTNSNRQQTPTTATPFISINSNNLHINQINKSTSTTIPTTIFVMPVTTLPTS